jgi:FkbM family methyltransferase
MATGRRYGGFVRCGDLVFDIGAHVGDRVASLRRLGAPIIAVEPQPALVKVLKLSCGFCADVAIEAVAVGHTARTTSMVINADNPTVSTVSCEFVSAACDAPGWETPRWTKPISVPVTTLGVRIGKYGIPAFIKTDVEGFEEEALQGLARAVKAQSCEFTIIQRDVTLACIERCIALGCTRFNAALGESQTFVNADWVGGEAIARWLMGVPHAANSGDIYATLA